MKYGAPDMETQKTGDGLQSPAKVALSPTMAWPPREDLYTKRPAAQPNWVRKPGVGWTDANPVFHRGKNDWLTWNLCHCGAIEVSLDAFPLMDAEKKPVRALAAPPLARRAFCAMCTLAALA